MDESKIKQLIDELRNAATAEVLGTTKENKESLIKRIERALKPQPKDPKYIHDENIWTTLVTLPYLAPIARLDLLWQVLCPKSTAPATLSRTWMEALPYPPRQKEGNTNLDMALGGIRARTLGGTENGNKKGNGIEFDSSIESVCFAEMKWFSDASKSVTHCKKRNQILRVIENLITFQDSEGNFPTDLHFTLVAPETFIAEGRPYSRYFNYILEDYEDRKNLLRSLELCEVDLPKRERSKVWQYPADWKETILGTSSDRTLHIHKVSYEELLASAPKESPLKEIVQKIFSERSGLH